jgi:triosephosphate isomerase (TIM)
MDTHVLQLYDGVMKRLIVANWKMNGSIALIQEFQSIQLSANIIVCPPSCYLSLVNTFVTSPGAQNCSHLDKGAFTGEISAAQLKELGCKYVIVGHSERRKLFNETDSLINQKASAAIQAGIIPIICVGETYEERNENRFKQVLLSQIDQVTYNLDIQKYIIAYEPIWSIGTGLIPTNEDIQEVLDIIRKRIGMSAHIIYGGSVTDKNALSLAEIPNLNGVLVGGASLNITTFQTIINAFQGD